MSGEFDNLHRTKLVQNRKVGSVILESRRIYQEIPSIVFLVLRQPIAGLSVKNI